MLDLLQPHSLEDWQAARCLVESYARSLTVDLSFQNFSHEIDHLAVEYSRPSGAFLIAREGGSDLGCVGVRKFAQGAGEIKRLYVVPEARGCGVGRHLVAAIVTAATSLGYRRLLLDTLSSMKEAQALYASLGFKPIAAYRFNPLAGAEYMELVIF